MIDSELFRLQIVVLAAGFSTRMKRAKVFAKIRGVSLIQRTVTLLAPFAVNRIIVVTAPRSHRMRVELRGLPVCFVTNPKRALGLSTSVVRALRASRFSSATLLLPADLAELNARDIKRLILRWTSAKRRVTARRLGNRSTTPLILPRRLYPQACRIAGDVGLRDFIAGLPREHQTLVELPSAARDVDTPEELGDSRRRARASGSSWGKRLPC